MQGKDIRIGKINYSHVKVVIFVSVIVSEEVSYYNQYHYYKLYDS